MKSTYSNLFNIEVSDIVRIIFEDQRAGRAEPAETAEVVMTKENARALGDLLVKLCK